MESADREAHQNVFMTEPGVVIVAIDAALSEGDAGEETQEGVS